MEHWYVAHTHAGAEAKAGRHLEEQGFATYLPRYRKRRRHARRTDWVESPLFLRYIFVAIDPDKTRWRAIQSTVGVVHLVCHGSCPTPVPAGVIEDIRAREDETGLVPVPAEDRLHKGEHVQIRHGALHGQIGLYDCASDRTRVFVLLELLGREVKVNLHRDAVNT